MFYVQNKWNNHTVFHYYGRWVQGKIWTQCLTLFCPGVLPLGWYCSSFSSSYAPPSPRHPRPARPHPHLPLWAEGDENNVPCTVSDNECWWYRPLLFCPNTDNYIWSSCADYCSLSGRGVTTVALLSSHQFGRRLRWPLWYLFSFSSPSLEVRSSLTQLVTIFQTSKIYVKAFRDCL